MANKNLKERAARASTCQFRKGKGRRAGGLKSRWAEQWNRARQGKRHVGKAGKVKMASQVCLGLLGFALSSEHYRVENTVPLAHLGPAAAAPGSGLRKSETCIACLRPGFLRYSLSDSFLTREDLHRCTDPCKRTSHICMSVLIVWLPDCLPVLRHRPPRPAATGPLSRDQSTRTAFPKISAIELRR